MSSKKSIKYTFIEFIAAYESKDFNIIDENMLNWANQLVNNLIKSSHHYGDCTKHSTPCELCTLELYLQRYHEYTFNTENFLNSI